LNPKFKFDYKFGFSQLFYNEYFTEYDANNFESAIGIKYVPKDWININAGYAFKISNAKAGDAFSDSQQVTMIKDGSYQADIFDLSIDLPAVLSLFLKPINLGFGAKYEHVYFQADNELDEYHYGREDNVFTFDGDMRYKIVKNFSLKCFHKYKFRNTGSPYTNVEVDKGYNLYETGVTLVYSL
jgi:hypothetical protein